MVTVTGAHVCRFGHRIGQPRRRLQALQRWFPERFAGRRILALQPRDVVSITSAGHGIGLPAVALQHLTKQLRIAPAVHQDVMAGVDQLIAVVRHPHDHQPQQWRRFHGKPFLALGRCEGFQVARQISLRACVVQLQRNLHTLVHHLQRTLEIAVPDKTAAQHVMGVGRRLPSLAEAFDIQPFDLHAHLVDVVAGLLLIQRVEQHALLHRRQWIEVLHVSGHQRQGVQLRLVEPGQGEVRRREAVALGLATVVDQLLQFPSVIHGQCLDRRFVEHLRAEGPVDAQLAGIDAAIEGQPVVQRRQRTLRGARRLAGRDKQAVGLCIEAAVELPQIIERDTRHRQCREGTTRRFIAQVAQHAKTKPFVGDGPQLLLDCLDRAFGGRRRGQAHREQAGEPTHAAAQVQIIEQRLAAMAFQLNQRRGLGSPTADHPSQRRQQQVVDLGAIGRRCLLQQSSGQCLVQPRLHLRPMAPAQITSRVVTRQVVASAFQLRLPVRDLALQRRAAGMNLQPLRPGLCRRGLGRQCRRLAGLQLVIGPLQIFQQNPPRHAVHHQVMDHQQQPLAAIGQGRQNTAQQRAAVQFKAALGAFGQAFEGLRIRDFGGPQQG